MRTSSTDFPNASRFASGLTLDKKQFTVFGMRTTALAVLITLITLLCQLGFGQGKAFIKSAAVPKISSTPKSVFLKSLSDNASIVKVRASLAEDRKNSESSRGGAGGTARLTMMRKFVRVEITGANVLSRPGSVQVEMMVKENGKTFKNTQTVKVNGTSSSYVIDTKGFVDKFGADIKTKTTSTTITSTKYIYDEAEVTQVTVLVKDTKGNAIYSGGWPDAPNIEVNLPAYLKPREFTSVDGAKMQALVVGVDKGVATFLIKDKIFKVPLESLIESDRSYLTKSTSPSSKPKGFDWAGVSIGDLYKSKQAPNFSKRAFSVSVEIEITNQKGGAIVAHGGTYKGYTLFLTNDGYCIFGIRKNQNTYRHVRSQIQSGTNSIVAGVDRKGSLTLRINDKLVASNPKGFWLPSQPGEGLSIGYDDYSLVDDRTPKKHFSGKLNSLIIQ